jgi:hypothetical protein
MGYLAIFTSFFRCPGMKNLLLPSCMSLLAMSFFSCNKTNSPNPTPSIQDSLPKTFSLYLPQKHAKAVEIFGYNTQTRLTTIHAYSYDSSAGTPVIDSFSVSFTLTSASEPPSAYDEIYHFQGDPPSGESEHHALFYDNQMRVTIDSITVSTANNFAVQHYQYDNNGNTTVQWLFGDPQTPGSYTVSQIDTMLIQNENILTDINYTTSDGTLNHLFTRSYSAHINPFYNAALANSLGCLMVFNNFFDYRSKNLPTQYTDQEEGIPTVTLDYLWTTDATGSVVKGVGTDAADGSVQQIYTYTY